MNLMKKSLLLLLAGASTLTLASCSSDSDVVNDNITKDADNFKIARRIVFVNGITDKYMLSVEGFCSINHDGDQLEVVCKTGNDQYKKHFLGLSDNVTYFAEQIDSANVSPDHYKVIFKPSVVVPDVEAR